MNKLKHINKMASVYRYATLLSNINHNLFICILILLILPTSERASAKVYGGQPTFDVGERRLTKEYHLRQGALRGLIAQPGRQYELQSVEMFLGIPYAAPPVGNLRFMPPGSALPWSGVKMATQFAAVCPQMLPNIKKENPPSSGRQQYLNRLIPFLTNESEDCLYLNIYAPYQEHKSKKLPVLVFIQGDSFEWSSGNPYDGRVLASYGNVMVITINFRLGILGFMKPSLTEHVYGNNGLLDQLAALQWIKDNIADLNGDPDSVTLMGHGTGAACVNFLMISPIANGLFHRAILMSGSALSDWALTKNPMQYTLQVAQHLHCNISGKNIMECLQNKRLSDIKKVQILARKFETSLGPTVAGSFILNEPAKTVDAYPNLFSKYELLSGVTELESYHEFGVIALAHGVLETERDDMLQQYAQQLFDTAPEIAVRDILQEYSPLRIDPQRWGVNANRDFILDVMSDARTVAPLIRTANYHSKANPRSYFYVFGHNSEHTDYAALRKSVHGEELPYVFGVPLGGAQTHFHEEYTAKERLLSEAVMRLWTNFVKGGTPNTQRIEQYLTLNSEDWNHYNIDWPEYNVEHQSFLRIDVPPSNFVRSFYRANYTKFWNEVLPNKMKNYAVSPLFEYEPVATTPRARKTLPSSAHSGWRQPNPPIHSQAPVPTYGRPRQYVPPLSAQDTDKIYKEIKAIKTPARSVPSGLMENPIKRWDSYQSTNKPTKEIQDPVKTGSATVGIIIAIGCIFLIVNLVIFATLYLKKRRLQARERQLKRENRSNGEMLDASDCFAQPREKTTLEKFKSGCSALKTINWNQINQKQVKDKNVKLESCKTPKSDDSGGFRRFKLRRHLSSSTIDANTKVRDWIANEIINRCSPPITRKSNFNIEMEAQKHLGHQKVYTKSEEVINKSSKSKTQSKESLNLSLHGESHLRMTSSSKIPVTKRPKTKTSEKTTSTSAHGSHSSIGNSKEMINTAKKTSSLKSNYTLVNTEERKSNKVSVAIDATPAARTSAILRQQPIEFSKSLEIVEKLIDPEVDSKLLKRSKTENDFSDQLATTNHSNDIYNKDNLTFTSVASLSLNEDVTPKSAELVKISHKHSSSDPVKDINYDAILQYTDFPDIPPPSIFRNEINVTSKDETKKIAPLTAAEALLTIKRRNYPKVLPDLPKSFTYNQKRLSLQPNSFQSFKSYLNSESSQKDRSPTKTPPLPPPRTTSTLDRRLGFKHSKNSATSSFDSGKTSFGSNSEKRKNNAEDYCNIDAISTMHPDRRKIHTNSHFDHIFCDMKETPTQPLTRDLPKIIIAANDIPSVHEPKIIIKPNTEKSMVDIHTNAPRVRLPDMFHNSSAPESERSGSSLSMILDSECDDEGDFEDELSDEKLLQELIGGIDTSFDITELPDTKGPDNSFEKRLEIVSVKINTNPIPAKNYEDYIYCSDDLLPDVSDLEKTAQIKQKFSLSKLQNRSESINQPPEKAVKLKDKKLPKTPIFLSKTSKDKLNCTVMSKLPKQKTEKKKIPLEHSYSGSSNDTESSTGTVKKVEIKK